MGVYLILMGVQGSGKGTQASVVRDAYDLLHISTGDLFRALKTRDDDFARKIQAIMAAGHLVSDEDTNEVLRDHLERTPHDHGVIFDGYPRNIAQAEWLDQYLAAEDKPLTAVVLLELDLYTAFKRAFGRVGSGENTYNIYYNAEGVAYEFVKHETEAFPPRLEATLTATGETLKRRPDDANADAVLKRIDIYMETTAPLIAYYEEKGLLVRISADQPIEAVSEQIKQAIDARRK